MIAQSIEELKSKIRSHNSIYHLSFDESWRFCPYYEHPDSACVEIPWPSTSGEFASFATTLPLLSDMDVAEWGGGTLVYTDWDIWDQDASLAGYQMVERIQMSFSEHRPFGVAPAFEFRADERLLMANFVLAAMIYGWDAYYFPRYSGYFVHISHDEYACLVTETSEVFERTSKRFLDNPELGYRRIENPRFCRPKSSRGTSPTSQSLPESG